MIPQNFVSDELQIEPGEVLGQTPMVFVIQKPTRISPCTTYGVVVPLAITDPMMGSPVRTYVQHFDPVSGAFLIKSKGNPTASAYTTFNATAERDGSIWWMTNYGAQTWFRVFLKDPLTAQWEPTGDTLSFGDYVPEIGAPVAMDSPARLLLACQAIGVPAGNVSVYDMDTKLLLRTIPIGSPGQQIILEDEARAFVICRYGIIVLIDYVQGLVLGTFRLDYNEDQVDELKFHAWDQFTRRLLVVDGGPTAKIRGYYPIPQAVALTAPIPLEVPRVGRTVRVATRAFGDTGEALGGVRVSATVDVGGVLRSPNAMTGATGYAIHHLVCQSAQAAATFDVEAEVL